MNLLALLALLLTLTAWVLTTLTGMNLFSGYSADRTCQTDCIKMFFFSGVATGVGGLVLSGLSLLSPQGRILSWSALLLAVGLCAIFVALFLIGTFA